MGSSGSVLCEVECKEDEEIYGVTVHGAKNLRNTDWTPLSGKSDPYCVCRIGPRGSSWDEKAIKSSSLEWKSSTISESVNPEWDMTFVVGGDWLHLARLDCRHEDEVGLEIEVAVFDADLDFDDCLGYAIVPLPDSIVNVTSEKFNLPLTRVKDCQGTVSVSFFTVCEDMFNGERNWTNMTRNCQMMDKLSKPWEYWLNRLWDVDGDFSLRVLEHLSALVGTIDGKEDSNRQSYRYLKDIIEYMRSPQYSFHMMRSTDGGVTNRDVLGQGTVIYLSHQEVSARLRSMCPHLQHKSAFRGNDAGPVRLNDLFTPLAGRMDDETHRRIRPVLDQVAAAALDEEALYRSACSFLDEHISRGKPLRASLDLEIWSKDYLHRVIFGVGVDQSLGKELVQKRKQAILLGAIPKGALEIPLMRRLLQVHEKMESLNSWKEKLRGECTNELVNSSPPEAFEVLAFFALREPALYFTMHVGLAILYSSRSPAPNGFELTEDNVRGFVLEVLRYRPFLTAVGYYTGPECLESQNTLLSLYCANRDPRAWGEDSCEFRIRAAEEYEKKLLSHANHAQDVETPANNRFCPFRDFSIALITAFFRAFLHRQHYFTVLPGVEDSIRITQSLPYVTEFTLQVVTQDKA